MCPVDYYCIVCSKLVLSELRIREKTFVTELFPLPRIDLTDGVADFGPEVSQPYADLELDCRILCPIAEF